MEIKSKRMQQVTDEMLVHGVDAVLSVKTGPVARLVRTLTADEMIVAAHITMARREGWSFAQVVRMIGF